MDGRGEKQAHVVVTSERHLHKAEITLHVHNHQLVGMASDSDVFTAMCAALRPDRKAGGQARRQVARDNAPVRADQGGGAQEAERARSRRRSAKVRAAKADVRRRRTQRVFRPDHHERGKPITLEEALLEMEDGRDYVAYRDADKQVVSHADPRRDGHYDLIET